MISPKSLDKMNTGSIIGLAWLGLAWLGLAWRSARALGVYPLLELNTA